MLATALALLSVLVPPAETELRGTSIVLVEGISGGIVGPTRHRSVTFGYDWNRGAFRAVEQRLERAPRSGLREFRACDLGGDRFRKIVERVIELGLPALPLEEPAGSEDLYHRNTGIRFAHAGRVWENQAPGGCLHPGSSVRVTAEQVAVFDAVLALLNGALAEGPLQPASALEAFAPRERNDAEIRMLARAADVLREMGLAGKADLNESRIVDVEPAGVGLRVPCRVAQPFRSDLGRAVTPIGWWVLCFAAGDERGPEVRETPNPGERPGDQARRAAFVQAHPELPAPQRDLILAGWVGEGISEALVRAAWGDPVERTASAAGVELRYVRAGTHQRDAQVTLHLGADGLQISW